VVKRRRIMAKKKVVKKEVAQIKIIMPVQEAVEDMLSDILKEKIEALIPGELVGEILKKQLQKKLESSLENKVNEWFDDFEDNLSNKEDLLYEIIEENEKQYKEKIRIIMNKVFDNPKVQKRFADAIIKHYLDDFEDLCIVDELLHKCFKEYEIKLVRKEGK
jgi:hypothetical protein